MDIEKSRIVIVGGPRTGKTTYADTFRLPVKHTDDLISHGWSGASEAASHWFSEPGPWVIEGVATARALRKWLTRNPDLKPCDMLYVLTTPKAAITPRQRAMGEGVITVFSEIEYGLADLGVVITNVQWVKV
jgi:dephospho-CoA kinase